MGITGIKVNSNELELILADLEIRVDIEGLKSGEGVQKNLGFR